jgi:hypothetical protein
VYIKRNNQDLLWIILARKYLKEALNNYTSRDKNSVPDIEKAKELLMTEVEILDCKAFIPFVRLR